MSQIRVKLIDQNVVFINTPRIYSGDVKTDSVYFEFDEVWDGYLKTAVFYQDVEKPYFVVVTDNKCEIPFEVMTDAGKFQFGVVGVLNDKVLTSELVGYDLRQGAATPADIPVSEDVWMQILNEANEIRKLASQMQRDQEEYQAEWNEKVDDSIKEAQKATVQCYDAISALNLEIYDMDGGDPFTTPSEDDMDANGGYPA